MNSLSYITNFDSVFSSLQLCSSLHSIFKNYLENIFVTLTKREEDDVNKISMSIFSAFLDLPLILGNKVFQQFDLDGDGYLSEPEFSKGMDDLFFGSFEKLKQIVFLIISRSDGLVYRDDVALFLAYLNSSENLIKNLELYISEFFQFNENLNYSKYNYAIENKNGNLFILFLIFIYRKQPFTEKGLKYLKENNKIEKSEKEFSLKSNLFQEKVGEARDKEIVMSINPEIMRILKFHFKQIIQLRRKNAKKNIFDYESINFNNEESEVTRESTEEMMETENKNKNFKLNKFNTKLSYSTNSTNNSRTSNSSLCFRKPTNTAKENEGSLEVYSENQINPSCKFLYKTSELSNTEEFIIVSPDFEIEVYKITNDNNKLTKHKMVIIENDIFTLKPSKNSQHSINSLLSLSGVYPTACLEAKLAGIVFYPMALINSYGNSSTHFHNLFFFKQKSELDKCVEFLHRTLNIRQIKNDYDIKTCLGRGTFAKVCLGVNKMTSEKVAIKIFKKKRLVKNDFELVRAEIDIMNCLKVYPHVNIVKPFNFYEDKDHIFIVMELLTGGSLNKFLYRNRENVNENLTKNLCKQVSLGINHLHENGIIHRDIKPDNIMLLNSQDDNPVLKIVDFGLSKVMSKQEKAQENFGTLLYSSPEILLRVPYDMKADVWSLGVLIFFINSGLFPFDGEKLTLNDISDKIIYEKVSFADCLYFSTDLQDLITKSLTKDPNSRLCVTDVLKSKWLS